VIYTNVPGAPANVVPGLGVPFAPGTSTLTFVRSYFSADDSQFAIEVDADTGSTTDDNILLFNNTVLLQEGTQAPWAPAGETIGAIDDNFGIDNSGQILIGNNTNGTAATTADDYIVLIAGGSFTVLAQEGQSVTPFLPSLIGTWDDIMDTCRLTALGPIWSADGIDGLPGGLIGDEVQMIPGGFLQESVDIPIGQAGGAMAAWENFDFEDLFVSTDGSIYLLQGDTDAATTDDDILTLNNVVVLQENQVIPGGPFAEPIDLNGIVQAGLDYGNNWYARGNNDVTEQDWVVRNGIVVAFSDGLDPIVPGANEHWDDTDFGDCFFLFDGNQTGAYIIGGVTDAASDRNGVIVYDDGSGNRVVAVRENDAVDIDGDGVHDDDLYFNTFGNDDASLLLGGDIVFTATLRNGAGTVVSTGVFRITPGGATCALRNGTGINPLVCDCTTLPAIGTNWDLTVTPTANTLATLVFATSAPLSVPLPVFGGEALILPPVVEIPATGIGTHSVALPNNPAFINARLYLQGLRVDAVGGTLTLELTNAIDAVVGQ
jgi:hypothetical protein